MINIIFKIKKIYNKILSFFVLGFTVKTEDDE